MYDSVPSSLIRKNLDIINIFDPPVGTAFRSYNATNHQELPDFTLIRPSQGD